MKRLIFAALILTSGCATTSASNEVEWVAGPVYRDSMLTMSVVHSTPNIVIDADQEHAAATAACIAHGYLESRRVGTIRQKCEGTTSSGSCQRYLFERDYLCLRHDFVTQ